MSDASATIGALAAALAAAQGRFAPIRKDRAGQVGAQRYRYATLDAVIAATAPALSEAEIAVIQSVDSTVVDGTPVATVMTTIAHSSGEWMRATTSAPIDRTTRRDGSAVTSQVQDAGKVYTYLRRYSLCAILGVTAEEDQDGATAERHPRPPKPKPKHHPSWTRGEQSTFCGALKSAHNLTYEQVAGWCQAKGQPRPSAMPAARRQKLMDWLGSGGSAEVREHEKEKESKG